MYELLQSNSTGKEKLTFFSFKAAMTSSPPLCCCNLCNRVKMRSSSLMIWTHTHARRPLHLHPGIVTFSFCWGVVFIVPKQKPKGCFLMEQEYGMFSFHKIHTFSCVWLLLRCLQSLRLWQMITFLRQQWFFLSLTEWWGLKEGFVTLVSPMHVIHPTWVNNTQCSLFTDLDLLVLFCQIINSNK